MSTPRTKRQFAGASADPSQRQITTYFTTPTSAASPLSHSHSNPSTTSSARPLQPTLPASVQSNLLSVGMRVRKSVPEGYKTGTSYGGFKLWEDAAGPAAGRAPGARKAGAQRELLPFCGIHSIGGLAAQPSAHNDDEPDLLDVPGLTSSQDTVESADERDELNARKRIYEEDEEDEEAPVAVWTGGEGFWDGTSPRAKTAIHGANARVFAVPRKSLRKSTTVPKAGADNLGQENMAVDDFEEADFLDVRVFGRDSDMSGM